MPKVKDTSRLGNNVVVMPKGSGSTGEVFTLRRSTAGKFRVMDASSFSKASRRASRVLEEDGRKKAT